MAILITGGTGYIGSHTCVELIAAGFEVVIVDNLYNSHSEVLERIQTITGVKPVFYACDIRDQHGLGRVFEHHDIEAVVHFAGLKAVKESVENPLLYYRTNVEGTLALLESMQTAGVRKLVFSSSATVYGDPHTVPIQGHFPLSATNPYGQSKIIVEQILRDLAIADPTWQVALLRYFNPVGAHPSGLIGEAPHDIPNNLMPYIAQVAIGKLSELAVFGDDYPTRDGTGVRDYIHVVDLAKGHVQALKALQPDHGCRAYNLGTGRGYSVLEMVKAFERACGRRIPYRISERRPGDVATCYADPSFATESLGWQAQRGLREMVRDHWNWQRRNPDGYRAGA